jgi:cysteine desulfurase family protein
MDDRPRIYLDNAATSWPKPPTVYEAVDRYQRELGAAAGRAAYREASEVGRLVADARRGVARLIGAEDSSRVVFTLNGTDSLNQAIHGVVRPGDHVITTVVEHNSVLRPLRYLEENAGVRVTRVPCDSRGIVDPGDIEAAITPQTTLIAMLHASNVTGALQPAAEVGRIARRRDVLFLLDAAQSLGYVPLSVEELNVDLLAAPGHKGLLGPLGTGVLYVRPGVEERLAPVRQGGTGTNSEDDVQPLGMPERYESGNMNVPGIAGLGAGVDHLTQIGLEAIRQRSVGLTHRLLDGLVKIDGITLYGPVDAAARVGVVSVGVRGYDSQEVSAMLDGAWRIQIRSGLHCAPRMHRSLGSFETGGTVRFSLGHFTTEQDIDTTIAALQEITAAGTQAG